MAPALMGRVVQADCQHCGQRVAFAAESFHTSLPSRCHRCGGSVSISTEVSPGQLVRLHALDTVSPKRFDVVALEHSSSPFPIAKRVWGLPGEEVSIRDGELWLGNQLYQKSLEEFERIAIPLTQSSRASTDGWSIVSDGGDAPPTVLPAMSDGDSAVTIPPQSSLCWQYQIPAAVHTDEVPPPEWLNKSPVTDALEINQGISYQPQTSLDLLVSIELANDHETAFEVYLHGTDEPCVRLHTMPGVDDNNSLRFSRTATIALCDGRLLIRCDGEIQATWDACAASTTEKQAPGQPTFHIRSSQHHVHIQRIAISRDIILRTLHRDGGGKQSFSSGPADGYFVLGDNQPASQDSRKFGWIDRSKLLGLIDPTSQVMTSSEPAAKIRHSTNDAGLSTYDVGK